MSSKKKRRQLAWLKREKKRNDRYQHYLYKDLSIEEMAKKMGIKLK